MHGNFCNKDSRDILSNTWRRSLTELGEMSGISNNKVSPHTFRHTGGIMNGDDQFSLQKIVMSNLEYSLKGANRIISFRFAK